MQQKMPHLPRWAKRAATGQARAAIAEFVNENVDQLGNWLTRIANGIPKVDAEGEPLRDSAGSIIWLNKPDPMGATKVLSDFADFHLPRLSRAEVATTIETTDAAQMSTEQLQRRLLISLGLNAEDAEILPSVPAERIANPQDEST